PAFRYGPALVTWDRRGLVRWDLGSGKKCGEWTEPWTDLAFTADGKRAVAGRGHRLRLYDETFKPLRADTEFLEAPSVHFRADGRLVAQSRWGGRLKVWEGKQGKLVENLWQHEPPHVGRTPYSQDVLGRLFVHHAAKGMAVRDLVTDRQVCLLEGVQ